MLLLLSFAMQAQQYFFEDFSGGEIPATWEIKKTNTLDNWHISLEQPDGHYEAVVVGKPEGGQENEWLITPSIDISNAVKPQLVFKTNYSEGAFVFSQLADFNVLISVDNGPWTKIWSPFDGADWSSWIYGEVKINLLPYKSSNIKIAYQLFTPGATHEYDGSVWIISTDVKENTEVPAESVVISPEEGEDTTMEVEENMMLQAKVFPDLANQRVTWSVVSGQEFVETSDWGVEGLYVSALSAGLVKIRATSVSTPSVFGDIDLIINDSYVVGCNYKNGSAVNTGIGISQVDQNQTADDLIVDAGKAIKLTELGFKIKPQFGNQQNPDNIDKFFITIRKDNQGTPGEIIKNYDGISFTSFEGSGSYFWYNITLPETIILNALNTQSQKYWVTVSVTYKNNSGQYLGSFESEGINGTSYQYRSFDNGSTWEPTFINDSHYEGDFRFKADCLELGTTENALTQIKVYPNPVSEILNIASDQKLQIAELFDFTGKRLIKTSSEKINVKQIPSGIYVLKVTLKNGEIITRKIIKK